MSSFLWCTASGRFLRGHTKRKYDTPFGLASLRRVITWQSVKVSRPRGKIFTVRL